MSIYICIIIILIFLIIFFINMHGKNDINYERHLYDNNKYAHFSKITSKNIIFHPKYIYTHPQKYILNEGDALIIPKKWWHWVFSYNNTLAINYWNDSESELFNNPKIINKFIDLLDLKKNERINKYLFNFNVLNGDTDILSNKNIKSLLNSKNNNEYLLTLDAFTYNREIKSFLAELIKHPKLIKDHDLDKNYNFWYSPNIMDTGLHYDDENGILCVLSGKKTVYLYPPSDSKYLYPYNIKPKWFYNNFEDIQYNIYNLNNNDALTDKIPSNRILYSSFSNKKKHMCRIVDEIYNYYNNKTIIWGIKNDKKNIWYEYYFYNIDKYRKTNLYHENFNIIQFIKYFRNKKFMLELMDINLYILSEFIKNKNVSIFSFEVHDNGLLDELDLYINNNDTIELPFYGTTYNIKKDIITKKNIFIVNEFDHFIKNIDYYCKYFDLIKIKDEIIKELNKYNYVKIMSFYKKSDISIAIQWFGITYEDMIDFLKKYNWEINVLNFYKLNDTNHLNNEITINYIITDNKLEISRTSIYGSI